METMSLFSSIKGNIFINITGLHVFINSLVPFSRIMFEVEGEIRKSWLKRTWKKLDEEESVMFGLSREDALCKSKWRVLPALICCVVVNLARLTIWRYYQIKKLVSLCFNQQPSTTEQE